MGEAVMVIRVTETHPEVISVLGRVLEKFASGEMSRLDVERRVRESTMALWVVFVAGVLEACAATEVVEYPSGMRAYRITLLNGRGMERWKGEVLKKFVYEAEREGCSRLEVVGRKGFLKVLEPDGFRLKYVVLVKEVPDVG